MSLPTALDYRDAIQNPSICFNDIELKQGTPVTDKMGLPKPDSGAFASVYRVICGQKDWAVKCFLTELPDLQQRYSAISQYLSTVKLPYTVGFDYLPQGIRIHGKWYPIVKMEWVHGEPLNTYIKLNINNSSTLLTLANNWVEMIKVLQQNNISHGDLQHGNILISNGDFRLIDYDGMYVPPLKGKLSHEIGHRNYQHPYRSKDDFGVYIDNFSSWVIYISIVALSIDSSLWYRLDAGEENLLFKKEDFEQPETSTVFRLLEKNSDYSIQSLHTLLKSFIYTNLREIPSVATAKLVRTTNVPLSNKVLPDWIKSYISDLEQNQPNVQATDFSETNSSWVLEYIKPEGERNLQSSYKPEQISSAIAIISIMLISLSHGLGLLAIVPFVSSLIGIFATFSGFLLVRYKKLPEVTQKNISFRNLGKVKKEISLLNTEIKQFYANKESMSREEERKVSELTITQQKCIQKEKDEISSIDNETQKSLSNLKTKILDIDRTESNELASALINYQSQYIYAQLQNYPLSRARIPGIGDTMKARLIRAGINSAGDIVNIQIYNNWSGGYSHEIAYIETMTKGRVHIDGIGPVKAKDILNWRKSLESKIRNNVPQRLEQSQINSIKMKYQNQKVGLEQQINATQQNMNSKKNNVHQQYSIEISSINRKISDIKNQYIKIYKDIDNDVDYRKKTLSNKNWELAKSQNEISFYKNIRFTNYLKHIFRGNKNNP